MAIASKSPGASATFYGFQQPVSLGKKLGSLAAGYVFGVADVNVCVGADPAAAGAAVADRNSWVLHYANNTVIDPAAIRYEGDPAPEYPFSQSAQVPNACIRGKIVYPVPRDMRPSVISYAPAGTTDVLTWHIN